MDKIQWLLEEIKTVAEKSWVEVKASIETKANEVIHSTNTWFGAELMEPLTRSRDIIDLTIANSTLLQIFRWNHGKTIPLAWAEVPVIWDTGFFEKAWEWTTGWLYAEQGQGTDKMPTAKVTIVPKKYKMTVDISDEQLKNPLVNIESLIMSKMSKSAIRTVEAVLLNWDTIATANTNINLIDWTPSAKSYYLNTNGLRKQAITKWVAWVDVKDMWAFTWATLTDIQIQGWYLASNPQDYVWISELKTHNKISQLTEYKDASQNWEGSTIKGKNTLKTILGSDLVIPKDLRLTNATWKISWTASNNTKWQLIYAHKDAVQYGFYGDYNFEVVRLPWTGIQVIGWFYFGFDIVNQLAWETDPTVILGYNATV